MVTRAVTREPQRLMVTLCLWFAILAAGTPGHARADDAAAQQREPSAARAPQLVVGLRWENDNLPFATQYLVAARHRAGRKFADDDGYTAAGMLEVELLGLGREQAYDLHLRAGLFEMLTERRGGGAASVGSSCCTADRQEVRRLSLVATRRLRTQWRVGTGIGVHLLGDQGMRAWQAGFHGVTSGRSVDELQQTFAHDTLAVVPTLHGYAARRDQLWQRGHFAITTQGEAILELPLQKEGILSATSRAWVKADYRGWAKAGMALSYRYIHLPPSVPFLPSGFVLALEPQLALRVGPIEIAPTLSMPIGDARGVSETLYWIDVRVFACGRC